MLRKPSCCKMLVCAVQLGAPPTYLQPEAVAGSGCGSHPVSPRFPQEGATQGTAWVQASGLSPYMEKKANGWTCTS